MNKEPYSILIYTDGAAKGNPGPGGYGIVMKTSDGKFEKRFSKGFRLTTNNRMELLAVIDALKKIKDKHLKIEIYSDSKYVVDAVNKDWISKWVRQYFAKTKNPDLWKEYIKTAKNLDISIHWIKGHNNHPENEICDKLAVKASNGKNLEIDAAYEKSKKEPDGLF